jgi:hypothetical protein
MRPLPLILVLLLRWKVDVHLRRLLQLLLRPLSVIETAFSLFPRTMLWTLLPMVVLRPLITGRRLSQQAKTPKTPR